MNVSETLTKLGVARNQANEVYKQYKDLKMVEDSLRVDLEMGLKESGLMSAKNDQFTASISQTPTIVVTHEQSVIDWLKTTPDVESDLYIGIKKTEFNSFAKTLLKGTGEVIPGTELQTREALSIKANKKG